jgi:hypothetical protein
VILAALLGAVAFWFPDILVHALSPNFGTLNEPLWMAVFLPVFTLGALRALQILNKDSGRALPVAMIVGVWALGPLAMMANASPSAGGFPKAGLWDLLLPVLAFPLFTPLMASRDGTLVALVAVTVALVFVAVKARAPQTRS